VGVVFVVVGEDKEIEVGRVVLENHGAEEALDKVLRGDKE